MCEKSDLEASGVIVVTYEEMMMRRDAILFAGGIDADRLISGQIKRDDLPGWWFDQIAQCAVPPNVFLDAAATWQ